MNDRRAFQGWQEIPRGSSEKEAKRPQARKGHIQTPGADLGFGGSTDNGQAMIPEVSNSQGPHAA